MCAFGRAATDIPGPVLMRFMFESVNRIHETMIYRPDTFRDAWIHFVSLIREPGANNVEFIFHPNSGNDGILGRWYPGDEYVDWLGCSLFNPQNIQDCARTAVYALLHDKPFGVVESAPTSQSSAKRRKRRNHSSTFKAKVALAASKDDKTEVCCSNILHVFFRTNRHKPHK